MQRSLTSISRLLVVLALCSCLATLVGCEGGATGPTGTVSGKVTYNDSPVAAGCRVTFSHDETSKAATGEVGGDGSYSLKMAGESGIPVGSYTITVGPPAGADASPDDPEAYAAAMEKPDGAAEETDGKPSFPDKYLTTATTTLTFTVKEGDNTFDVKMTD